MNENYGLTELGFLAQAGALRISDVGHSTANLSNLEWTKLQNIWAVLYIRVPSRVLFIRVPYYFGDLKRDASLEN